MSAPFDQILQAALGLPPQERANLIDSLIATFPQEDAAPLDDQWLAEIERRSAEIDAGTAELVPWEEVRRRVTSRLKSDG